MPTTIGLRRLGRNKRGVSAVIVVVLSLVILVTIASNVILWSYQMNQVDWERMKEDFAVTDVSRVRESPWFVAQNEYDVRIGSRLSGTYADTRTVNDVYERFMEGLSSFEYDYMFKASSQQVSTTSSSPVDDSEASLTITLSRDSYVLAVYNAGNRDGSIEDSRGKGCAVNIDGADVAFSWQSPRASNRANAVTVVWAGWLNVGAHSVKGRFFSNVGGSQVGVDVRQLALFWFSGAVAQYTRSTVRVATTSINPVDDGEAVVNLSLEEGSVALILYNIANQRGSAESSRGKGATINIDGVDVATREWQSPHGTNNANSVAIVYATFLDSGQHTVRGRFFSNRNGQTATIDERQLAVICFPANAVKYAFKESVIPVSTTSGAPINDTEAQVSLNLPQTCDCLFFYTAGNMHGASEYEGGKGLSLSVNGVDKSNSTSWQSPYSSNYANSALSLWCEQVPAGNLTIQGRFFANLAGFGVTLNHRQLLALTFSKPATNQYRLDLAGSFQADLSVYPLAFIKGVEMQLRYRANSTDEMFYLKAYNWSAAAYMDSGFNITSGHLPSTEWSYYAVNLTDQWSSYVNGGGEIRIKILDEGFDSNQTMLDIDFLAVRVVFDATRFSFKNKGGSTLHIVALWVTNTTHHQRFSVDYFINSGESATLMRFDIVLPATACVVKAVTERGNMAAYAAEAA